MAPKKQQSKAEGAKKKENNRGGGNKATTSTEDDDCADMPPLEDMRKVGSPSTGKGSKGGEGQGKKEEIKLPEVRWNGGTAPLGLTFATESVREAYRMLKVDPGLNDEKMFTVLNELLTKMVSGALSDKDPGDEIGAVLLIACSKATEINNLFFALVQKVYMYESNYHLRNLRLPIPKSIPTYDTPALVGVVCEEATSPQTLEALKRTQELTEKERARIATSEKEAKESKGALEKLKTELVEYKAEVKEGYKARDEKAAELEKAKSNEASVKSELEKEKSEVAKLKEELAKLRASSSSSNSSQVASSDKTSFVIKSLSRQVKDLGRQVKEKNDQLAEMMVEMSKVGFE